MPVNRVESIVLRHADPPPAGGTLAPGDLLALRPAVLMTHDNTSAVRARFTRIGARRVLHPERAVVVLDHDIQNTSPAHLAKYRAIEAFAREQGMAFHAAGSGIGHQVMIETGRVRPGALAVAADSHANMYGAVGALGAPIARSDAAGVWAAGVFWWEMPEVVRVVLEGRLPAGATGKDAILALCAMHPDDVVGRAVEFEGPGIASLPMDDRLTIANMTTEWGAAACAFPPDGDDADRPDPGARYAATIRLDLGAVAPFVSGPDTLARAVPLATITTSRIKLDKAYLVSCANGRLSDLDAAAAVLDGKRVAPGVALYVAAASADVERRARASGAWTKLLDAGAVPLPSGCGPCIGLGTGLLEPGETGISASNRNFKGRMGSKDARCYLASPAVVAASAVAGYIDGPAGTSRELPAPRIEIHEAPAARAMPVPGEPRLGTISGRLVVFLRDAIDTDALCPKELVYKDDATNDELAAGVFAHLAPGFSSSLRAGDILVAGARFGIGSSREQAARALMAAGVRAVVAASISSVFRRNALNNGLPAIESRETVERLRAGSHGESPAVTGSQIAIDLDAATIDVDGAAIPFAPLPAIARDLLAAGGLDGFVRERMP